MYVNRTDEKLAKNSFNWCLGNEEVYALVYHPLHGNMYAYLSSNSGVYLLTVEDNKSLGDPFATTEVHDLLFVEALAASEKQLISWKFEPGDSLT